MSRRLYFCLLLCLSFIFIKGQQLDTASVSASEFKKLMADLKGTLIDVRTPEEYNKDHIAGAINIDVKSEKFDEEIKKLNLHETYFIYCGIGKRGALAMQHMAKAGFKKVYNMAGGLEAWKKEHYKVTK